MQPHLTYVTICFCQCCLTVCRLTVLHSSDVFLCVRPFAQSPVRSRCAPLMFQWRPWIPFTLRLNCFVHNAVWLLPLAVSSDGSRGFNATVFLMLDVIVSIVWNTLGSWTKRLWKKTASIFYLDRCYFSDCVDLYTHYYWWEMMSPAVELLPRSLLDLSVSLFLLDPNIHGGALGSWGRLAGTRQWFTGPTGPWTLFAPLSSVHFCPLCHLLLNYGRYVCGVHFCCIFCVNADF